MEKSRKKLICFLTALSLLLTMSDIPFATAKIKPGVVKNKEVRLYGYNAQEAVSPSTGASVTIIPTGSAIITG